jgi:hypothetical protein
MRQQAPVAGAVSAALSPMLATSAALIVLPQSRRPRSVRLTGWVSGPPIAIQNAGLCAGARKQRLLSVTGLLSLRPQLAEFVAAA